MKTLVEPKAGYLKVTVEGFFQRDKLPDLFREIFTASTQSGLRKILIDITKLHGEIPAMARFEAGQIASDLNTNCIRLALVGTEDQLWPDRFFENVANNRGLMTRVTTDPIEALEWLSING